ncbi:MAG: hypothetical protein GXX85_00785 [Ignavibacteria bacterium]|nr:hypothetical protein [Ignavibacteria bacterium]
MEENTTIRVEKVDKDLLDTLRKRDGISSNIKYFKAMVEFFNSTGLNPSEKVKSTSGELKKLRDVVVSFTRTQEEKKLDPIMKTLDELTNTLLNFLKSEALRKQDFIKYMDSLNLSNSGGANIVNNQRAKELFNEFISKMNSKMSGYSVDKKTVQHYKNQFESL